MYLREEDLDQFAKKINLSPGVKYVIKSGNAQWLVDMIKDYGFAGPIFQIWKLKVSKNKSAILTMWDANEKGIVVERHIQYTDFPLESLLLCFKDGELMLENEE